MSFNLFEKINFTIALICLVLYLITSYDRFLLFEILFLMLCIIGNDERILGGKGK